MKPVIGILTVITRRSGERERTGINTDYVNAVIKGGGIPLLLPVTDDSELLNRYISLCDGFLFSGGVDISPHFFGEEPSRLLGATSLKLDLNQLALCRGVIEARKPYLGICRGIQLVNVACGGTLYQDILEFSPSVLKHQQETDSGDFSHLVSFQEASLLQELFGDSIRTNSYHHQSVKITGSGLRITGRTSDGIIEALEAEDYPFGVSVQWHPEIMLNSNDTMKPLFERFINACTRN